MNSTTYSQQRKNHVTPDIQPQWNWTRIVFKTALFCTGYALVFKWIQYGNPFHTGTIVFGTLTFFMILTALSLAKFFFLPYLEHQTPEQLKKTIVPAFLLFMASNLLGCLLILALCLYVLDCLLGGMSFADFLYRFWDVELMGTLKFYFICVLAGAAFFFHKIGYQSLSREQRLKEENQLYKYRNLKTQVNPHFLFNSLNTLSELVYEDPRKADQFIQKLAGIYRYILEHEETDLVPLSEELDFVTRYFDLQKERAGSRLQLKMEIDHPSSYRILPVSLQILVENAIKHNAATPTNPLRIHIYKGQDHIVVSNNLQRKSTLMESFQTGLSNLSQRIKQVTGREMTVTEEPQQFSVQLPLVSTPHL